MVKHKDFFLLLKPSDVYILLLNVKMPTIVGILTFMSGINFMLSRVGHENSYISGFTLFGSIKLSKHLGKIRYSVGLIFH